MIVAYGSHMWDHENLLGFDLMDGKLEIFHVLVLSLIHQNLRVINQTYIYDVNLHSPQIMMI